MVAIVLHNIILKQRSYSEHRTTSLNNFTIFIGIAFFCL